MCPPRLSHTPFGSQACDILNTITVFKVQLNLSSIFIWIWKTHLKYEKTYLNYYLVQNSWLKTTFKNHLYIHIGNEWMPIRSMGGGVIIWNFSHFLAYLMRINMDTKIKSEPGHPTPGKIHPWVAYPSTWWECSCSMRGTTNKWIAWGQNSFGGEMWKNSNIIWLSGKRLSF